MKNQKQGNSLKLAGAAAILMLLYSLGAAAQEPGRSSLQTSTPAAALSNSGPASSPNSLIMPSKPAAKEEVAAARPVEASPFITTGSRLFSIPRFVARTWKVENASGSSSAQQPGREAPLVLSTEQKKRQQLRPVSNIPENTSPTMFPGSSLRGPFQQIYPRPFPGGGQP